MEIAERRIQAVREGLVINVEPFRVRLVALVDQFDERALPKGHRHITVQGAARGA